jgi:hypothetical protein
MRYFIKAPGNWTHARPHKNHRLASEKRLRNRIGKIEWNTAFQQQCCFCGTWQGSRKRSQKKSACWIRPCGSTSRSKRRHSTSTLSNCFTGKSVGIPYGFAAQEDDHPVYACFERVVHSLMKMYIRLLHLIASSRKIWYNKLTLKLLHTYGTPRPRGPKCESS